MSRDSLLSGSPRIKWSFDRSVSCCIVADGREVRSCGSVVAPVHRPLAPSSLVLQLLFLLEALTWSCRAASLRCAVQIPGSLPLLRLVSNLPLPTLVHCSCFVVDRITAFAVVPYSSARSTAVSMYPLAVTVFLFFCHVISAVHRLLFLVSIYWNGACSVSTYVPPWSFPWSP